MASNRRRVVLHFDLNRTILMSDAAGGRTMEDTVNYLLSECTWGYINPKCPSEWICVSTAASIDPPKITSRVPHLVTYKQFVDDAYPYETVRTATTCTLDQIKTTNKVIKSQRTALQSAFIGGKDTPGYPVQHSFTEVMQHLYFPHEKQQNLAKQLAANMPLSSLQQAWSEGRFYLLPSFLHFLSYLNSPHVTKLEIDVKLVFRTFGKDLKDVAQELELLIAGQHPMMCPALPDRFRLDVTRLSHSIGAFYRHSFDANGTTLAVGTLTKQPFLSKDSNTTLVFDTDINDNVKIVRGFQSIQETLEKMMQESNVLALRDDYEWWSTHAEDAQYGKLLLVNEKEPRDIVVFFDDHIEAHDAHIVDVRDLESGEPVDFVKSRGKYLQRVEPLAAILDPNYFITLFEKHNLRMDSRSAKRKRTDTSRVITSERTLEDVELELLHALEEEIKKEEKTKNSNKIQSFPLEDENYDESDDE
ncbi:uncharacterized protein PHALS_06098 [Plasmopara halstedii]|uniref:Uncharacterized protein n=1 Tax=Plasmopara halstedii TaxID=4781 RepID=A0A0P1B2L1_PLAHL|nr:uncharacterized protein PHALS_06098 [Plasmopara halstedii]CEG48268.1 hypothetical protein PHALS_06098 [Plasmopara halstedii]|eukprot:XP_024584637.1 hypothetical protein PHALS_06098 [Plasmopara halstedii]